jgi:hypothetical protein
MVEEKKEQSYEVRDKLDFKQLLFLQMLQLTKENHDPVAYEENLEVLEMTLSPYFDEEYRKKIDEIDTRWHERKTQVSNEGKVFISRYFCGRKHKLLMELARRKGLLPEEGTEYTFEED